MRGCWVSGEVAEREGGGGNRREAEDGDERGNSREREGEEDRVRRVITCIYNLNPYPN